MIEYLWSSIYVVAPVCVAVIECVWSLDGYDENEIITITIINGEDIISFSMIHYTSPKLDCRSGLVLCCRMR
jgi:hypothetical protein